VADTVLVAIYPASFLRASRRRPISRPPISPKTLSLR
jgi:hypothetical protein